MSIEVFRGLTLPCKRSVGTENLRCTVCFLCCPLQN